MSVPYEDTNFDFDLDFLSTGSVKSVVSDSDRGERSRKAILITKKKIIATDSLIRRYYDKKDEVEQLEKSLQTSKEDCKQICLDFKSITEKCNLLEKEAVNLRITNDELKDLYSKSESVNGAINSHANQLQVLVKEKDATIDSLQIENQLLKATVKDSEKQVISLEKVNSEIRKDIALLSSIISGKRKLNKHSKLILQKYEKCYVSGDEDSVFDDEIDTDTENEAQQVMVETPINSNIKGVSVPSKTDTGHDSDYSNEIASADTGRGSSLASSDGEKCFNSPDYFLNHSPIDIHHEKEKRLYIDTATSPIDFEANQRQSPTPEFETIVMVLSPIINEDELEVKVDLTNNVIESEPLPNSHIDADANIMSENNNEIDSITSLGKQNISPVDNNFSKTNHKSFSIFEPEYEVLSNDNHDNETDYVKVNTLEPVLEKNRTDNLDSNILLIENHEGRGNAVGAEYEPSLSNNLDSDSVIAVDAHCVNENSANLHPRCENKVEANISHNNSIEIDPADLTKHVTANNILVQKDKGQTNLSRNSTENYDLNRMSTSPVGLKETSNKGSLNEKECLELNNSDHLNKTNSSDCEVELILNEMRLNNMLLTPIPSTPSKTPLSDCRERSSKATRGKEHVCKVAIKVKEESKILQKKYSKLEQEINLIKGILKNNFAINNLQLNLTENETIERIPNHTEYDMHVSSLADNNISLQNIEYETNSENSLSPPLHLNRADSELFHPSISDTAKVSSQSENSVTNNCPTKDIDDTSLSTEQRRLSNNIMENSVSFNNEPDSNSIKKPRKLSKLERLRRTLVPQNKIKKNINSPTRQKRTTLKRLSSTKKIVNDSDTAATLNDKCVYEKAVQIMSDLKFQNKFVKTQEHIPGNSIETNVILEKHNISGNIEKINHVRDSSPINELITNDCKKQLVVAKIKCDKHVTSQIVTSPSPKNHICTRSRSNIYNEMDSTEKHITDNNNLEISIPESSTNLREIVNNEKQITKKRRNMSKEIYPTEKQMANGNTSEISEYGTRAKSPEIVNNEKQQFTMSRLNVSNEIDTTEKQMTNPSENSASSPKIVQQGSRKRQKRESIENQDVPCKRILRSSNLSPSTREPPTGVLLNSDVKNSSSETIKSSTNQNPSEIAPKNVISYSDIEMFTNSDSQCTDQSTEVTETKGLDPKQIIFCSMLDKYGKKSHKNQAKKLPESIIASATKTIQKEITIITQLNSNEAKNAMNKLVNIVQTWEYKRFIAGLMSFLKDGQRKLELFNKVVSPPAPPMTKSEQILLYVISQLMDSWSSIDILNCILCNIEYELFKLNRTPEFDIIESMSHFYAVLCRYFKLKSRLRLFMLDAMYCIQYKAVPLIKQCLEVWMHVLPLAHMGIAKSPLVTCLVYLLHFYKCDDRTNRVQEIRNILNRKYFYEITEWNEPKILEMFKNAILEVKAMPIESKMLRIALIIVAKRHGPKWCQKNIVKKVLLPVLENKVPDRVKIFCISILGPLLKPYPVDMKVHCEIVMNMLLDKLEQNPTLQMQEAIVTSLIYMSKHNHTKVIKTLLTWKPKQVSPDMERMLKDFVTEKPLKVWRAILLKVELA